MPAAASSNIVAETIKSFVFAILVCSVVYLFLLTPNQVEGSSMNSSFENGELVLTNKVSEWLGETPVGEGLGLDYHRGDVVVISKPNFGKPIIKRIVGMPGEKIEISNGKVMINGSAIDESYVDSNLVTIPGTFLEDAKSKLIPDHHYAVMGDNRENSLDSRYSDVGFINRDWIEGKVIFRYWPPAKFGAIGSGKSSLN